MAKLKTLSYSLTLPLKTELYEEDILNKRFDKCRRIYNSCLSEALKRYNHMIESKIYKNNCKYKGKDRNKIFNDINMQYGLTKYSLINYVKPLYNYFNIDGMTGQKLASRAFKTIQKLMFHQAKKVNFIKYDELSSVEGANNTQGIIYRNGIIKWQGLKILVIIKPNDIYVKQSLESPIKYCRIKREIIKGKYHYYAQLILEGIPPIKINKETGEIKRSIGQGNVGIDMGTQTIAYSSQYEVKLLELAPKVNNINRQIKLLERKMDRSQRATNTLKYNENGTINTHNKGKWVYSNHYIKIKNERKELYRKQSAIKKQNHNILANQLLILGDKFYVETMNYKGLQSRSKKTTINEKTRRINKKKRFGKSVANKAPSMFLTILDNKLKWNGTKLFKIDTTKVKASQYNHITNDYHKKKLSERWNDFGEFKIQRDLYSSFLLMNVKDNLKEIDRELCFKTFDNFKTLHDKEIDRLLSSQDKIISSMGL